MSSCTIALLCAITLATTPFWLFLMAMYDED